MRCPECESNNTIKNGTYPVREERIQKYICKECSHYFIENPEKYQKKSKELDEQLIRLHQQNLSRRRIANILKISKRTVDLRLKKLL